MGRFSVSGSPIAGVQVISRSRIGDDRGFLSRIFCAEELAEAGWIDPIVQINHTLTSEMGTVRGMHYQCRPHAEMKLVSCIRGVVWDVAVDLRASSQSYLQWYAAELSADNGRALLIPQGCAHGFQALTADCELIYLHSAAYAPGAEAGLSPLDPTLGIAWPLSISQLSERDRRHPQVADGFEGVEL